MITQVSGRSTGGPDLSDLADRRTKRIEFEYYALLFASLGRLPAGRREVGRVGTLPAYRLPYMHVLGRQYILARA